jgi:hypothetical protein
MLCEAVDRKFKEFNLRRRAAREVLEVEVVGQSLTAGENCYVLY